MNEFILIGIVIGFALFFVINLVFSFFQDDAILLTRKQTQELVEFIIKLDREDSKKILDIIK
jgi:hypothetical protein